MLGDGFVGFECCSRRAQKARILAAPGQAGSCERPLAFPGAHGLEVMYLNS